MFYYKPIKNIRTRKVHFRLNNFLSGVNSELDESVLSPNYAKSTYNFNINGGSLKDGMGIKEVWQRNALLSIQTQKPVKIFHYKKFNYEENKRDDRLIIYTESGMIVQNYLCRPEMPGIAKVYDLTFTSEPVFINYNLDGEDVVIMCSKTDKMVVYDGENMPRTISSAPKITSMCIHYERLFATSFEEKNTLWFSDDLNPTNWNVDLSDAGYIDIPSDYGRLLKVVSFLDYIYIFREYGITKVTAYSVQQEFKVNELFSTSGKIMADSISLAGDRIIFLTEDGLYMFDGFNINKVYGKLDNLFKGRDNSKAKGCYYNGKYYLLCNINFEEKDENKNNALVEIDITRNTINISKDLRILDMESMMLDESALFFAIEDNSPPDVSKRNLGALDYSGKRFKDSLNKSWETPQFDFGVPEKLKSVNSISVKTSADIKITIKSERAEREIVFNGSERMQKKKICIAGKSFSMKIETNSNNNNISNVVLDGVVYGD